MTLTHPWFLLGLLALVIPVLIHLYELRRPQRVLFTNVEFIREVKLVTAKQRRLQHLLVLLLRLGFLTFLVLLFCQPFIRAPRQTNLAGVDVNVLVDDSPSMTAEGKDGKPLLEQAVVEMQRIGRAFPNTVRYRLWSESTPQSGVTADKMAEALGQVEVSAVSNGVGKNLRRALHQQASATQAVLVASDFQKSDFGPAQVQAMRNAGEMYLLPLSAPATPNTYVDSVYLEDEFVRPGMDLPLHVRLRNGGSKDARNIQVRVLLGSRQVASYEASVGSGATSESILRIRLTDAAVQLGRVEIDEQPFAFDNTYFFTLKPAGRIQVVDISPGGTSTQKLYPNETVFAYSQLRPEATTLTGPDLVLVQGDARMSESLRAAIREFVRAGGTLVLVPSAAPALRASQTQMLTELGLTTVRWNGGNPVAQELAVPNQQNPFFKDVFAGQARQPDMPRATPLLSWARSTTDVLQFRDGQPFLSGFRSGEGMVYAFASPWQAGFSSFTEHPLFVPVMYRLATLSKTSEQLPAYRLTERAVVLRAPVSAAGTREQVYKLSSDSASFVTAQQVRNGRLYLQLPAPLRRPGFYRLSLNDKEVTTLAFNVDKKESELAQYSAEELRQLTAAYPNVHVYEAGGERSAAAQLAEERNGTPLWRYCLLAALLCLLGEVLVLRFGGRRPAEAVPAA